MTLSTSHTSTTIVEDKATTPPSPPREKDEGHSGKKGQCLQGVEETKGESWTPVSRPGQARCAAEEAPGM